jgi:transposase
MSKALSLDLRRRVLAAVAAGQSCRQAAERFGVSASSAIRWRGMEKQSGNAMPKQQGGDQRSYVLEAHGDKILGLIEATRDITLTEIKAGLEAVGVRTSIGALWRFLRRHQITLKKSRRTPRSRTAQTSH